MGEKHNDKHALAINILKFQYYNFKFMDCREIIIFETLIVVGGISYAAKEEFFHSTQTLSDKTGIKRHSVDKILRKFKNLGFIDYQVKGMPQVKHIRINWEKIFEMLPEIYQFDKVEEYFGGSIQPFIDYHKQFVENNKKITENTKEKNTIKNSTEEYKEEYKKEINVNAESARKLNLYQDHFNNVLGKSLENYNQLHPNEKKDAATLKITINDVVKIERALSTCKIEILLNAFEDFCDDFLIGNIKVEKSLIGYFLKEEDEGGFPLVEKHSLKCLSKPAKKQVKFLKKSRAL